MSTNNTDNTASKPAKRMNVRTLTGCAMLSGIAFILMYFEIVVPFMPSFIKFDFSDLPALLGAFAYGPAYGVLICLIKNILHLAFSQSMFVGELSNFILGACFVLVAGLIYKKKKTKKRAIWAGITGAVVMGLFSVVSNYFFVYPVYYNFMPKEVIIAAYQAILSVVSDYELKDILPCLLIFNLPFTVLKGLICVLISNFIYKPLSPILKGRQ